MGQYAIRLPDIGEGIVEAELVEWTVAVGDDVREDSVLAAVMTDKATVEIPSPVSGRVAWLGVEVGETIAVGAEFVRLEVEGNIADDAPRPDDESGGATPDLEPKQTPGPKLPETGERTGVAAPIPIVRAPVSAKPSGAAVTRAEGERPLASPSVRLRAREAGIDLRRVRGSGPAGRIVHGDLDALFETGGAEASASGTCPDHTVTEVKLIGLRRRIAERMALANSRIPHFTIVEEADVSELEALRDRLNANPAPAQTRLTPLPLLIRALVRAVGEQPALNACFDDDAGILRQYGGVHVGIATQTPDGLMVPVVRHAESLGLRDTAAEITRLVEAARAGRAKPGELSGSTISITSLGVLGAIATTPIINPPEVAIVGVNRMEIRAAWRDNRFVPRKMMNLSCSFDHRVVDGWHAAVFVRRMKTLLETPAMIFVED